MEDRVIEAIPFAQDEQEEESPAPAVAAKR
jgi:hypothetical protein